MNNQSMNSATPANDPATDKAKATRMEEVLTALLLEAKEVIATHQNTLLWLTKENDQLRHDLEDLQSALLTGRLATPRPPRSKTN